MLGPLAGLLALSRTKMSPLHTKSYPYLGAMAGESKQLLKVTDSSGKRLRSIVSRTGHLTPHLCPALPGKNLGASSAFLLIQWGVQWVELQNGR